MPPWSPSERTSHGAGLEAGPLSPQVLDDAALLREIESIPDRVAAERSRERSARAVYRAVADDVDARIERLRARADACQRELDQRADRPIDETVAEVKPARTARYATLADAVLAIWSLDAYQRPLTTADIARALGDVGYESRAAPRSLRSTINQTLTRLCREGRVRKYRMDGTPVPDGARNARARRYMPVEREH